MVVSSSQSDVTNRYVGNKFMGMFDWYEPIPTLSCPVCKRELSEWQGTDGRCGLFVFRQGGKAPVAQRVDDECQISLEAREKVRLPKTFRIRSCDCGCPFPVVASCITDPEGTWTESVVVTAETNKQDPDERKEEFRARQRWLEGRHNQVTRSAE